MNLVSVEGSYKRRRLLTEDVVFFCIEKIMPKIKTLEIDVTLKNIKEADGYCYSITTREFDLEIDKKLSEEMFISTIAHEMVHVWQYATKQLTQKYNKEFWKGNDYTDTPYHDVPWEKQALLMEVDLLKQYKEYRNEK